MRNSRARGPAQTAIRLWAIALLSLGSVNGFAFPAKFGLSPDNSQELLLSAIRSARSQLWINVYEFDSDRIADALAGKIADGVEVRILVEGQLAEGAYSSQEAKVLNRLYREMRKARSSQSHIFVKNKTTRFRFDHAKYVVIDGSSVLVSSDNFKASGHPDPGRVGNRGWEVLLQDPELASSLSKIFLNDTDLSQGDIREPKLFRGAGDAVMAAGRSTSVGSKRTLPAFPVGSGDVERAELVVSPHSLDPILEMIRSAKSKLEVEFMSLPPMWRKDPNPLVSEIIAAARRGVQTRVILTPSFPGNDKNEETVRTLEQLGRCQNLPIQARIIDKAAAEIALIHNKGIRVDDDQTLVSSINGTETSIQSNREAAVHLYSKDAATYFDQAFDFDWSKSPEPSQQPCALAPQISDF